jgi:hypothetical protein
VVGRKGCRRCAPVDVDGEFIVVVVVAGDDDDGDDDGEEEAEEEDNDPVVLFVMIILLPILVLAISSEKTRSLCIVVPNLITTACADTISS